MENAVLGVGAATRSGRRCGCRCGAPRSTLLSRPGDDVRELLVLGDLDDRDQVDVAGARVDLVDARRGPRSPARPRGSGRRRRATRTIAVITCSSSGRVRRQASACPRRGCTRRGRHRRTAISPGRARPRPLRPAPGAARRLAPRRVDRTSRVPPPVSQRCSSRTSSAAAPRQRAGPGQHRLRAGPQRVDHGHRRHAAARDPGRGEPAVPHHRQLPAPAPVRPGADHLGEPGQRGQPLRPAERPRPARRAGRAGGRPPRTARAPARRRPRPRGSCSGPSHVAVTRSGPGRRRRGRSRRRPGARRTARRTGAARTARTGPPRRRGPGCAACTAAAGRRRATVSTASRAACGAERAERAVARRGARRDSRGNASAVAATHHRRVRVAGAAVVAGPVRGDQPQLPDARLQGVRAHDRVDPLAPAPPCRGSACGARPR